jgi:hypothetical protein
MKDITTGSSDSICYFDLGNLPFVNNLNDSVEESLNCEKFPLSISLFEESGLSRLNYVPDTKLLFDNYLYLSGTNKPYYTHCCNMFNYLKEYLNINENDLIVDIGGNDGTLLKAFIETSKLNLNVLNIEPSSVSEISERNGIKTLKEYFSKNTYFSKKAKLITTTNVFQHLFDIKSFVDGVVDKLDDNGIWCLEFPYWFNTMETLQFDQIYHEHIYYYNLEPLNKFFSLNNLRIFNVIKQDIHSGSLRLLICKNDSKYITEEMVNIVLLQEKNLNKDYYLNWGNKIIEYTKTCKTILDDLTLKYNVIGFGAAAKGCIFLNYLNIKNDKIKYVIDDTIIKQGKFIPGTGIEIVNRDILSKLNIDYIIILAHNFSEYIMKSLKESGYKGKFVTFLPELNIYS